LRALRAWTSAERLSRVGSAGGLMGSIGFILRC